MENNKSNKLLIFLLIFTAAILGGGAGVFGKIALKEIPPFSFTFLRFLVASFFLIPFSLKYLPTFKKKDLKIILLSLIASLNVIFFAFGIKHTTANISQMIYTAVPIVSALLSFYYLNERFGVKKIIGIIVGFIGTILVVLLPLFSTNYNGSTIGGNLIIVFAMLSISLYWVLSKKFQSEYSPLQINNYFIFTTTVLLFFLSIFDLIKEPYWWNGISTNAYLSLIFVAIFSTAIYYLISQIIVKKSTPVMASMILYIQPFATFIWAYYFLSEKLSFLFIVGAIMSLLGVGIYNLSIKNKKDIKFTALFVKDSQDLLKRFPPKHKNIFGHHSTIEFQPENLEGLEIGKYQRIKIIGRAYDEFGDDLLVENQKSKNKYPHITLSRGENAPLLYSKILFEKAINSNKMEFFENESIEVVEGYSDENNHIIKKI